ncbi:MAG: tetratricopeptide repeat protein, partial [Terriglobales bacterium]
RAISLLRPLAKADVPGKKAELADLDAMWGDESIRDGKLEQGLRCWEEVRDLREGSRASEAESRLATIYSKLANNFASDADPKNDGDALKYLNKLNNMSQNPKYLEMAADLYEKQGQMELAIDQLRKASRMNGRNPVLERKLAAMLSRRGKELLDEGNTDAGYGYLQQAKQVSPESGALPAVALRNVNIGTDRSTHMPKISGDVWNPTDRSISSLTMKVELVDAASSKVMWTKDQKLIDEFVPAMGSQESKRFEIVAGVPARSNGSEEFRVYLDGSLYKAYKIGEKAGGDEEISTGSSEPPPVEQKLIPPPVQAAPPTAPAVVKEAPTAPPAAPETAPIPGTVPPPATDVPRSSSPEEKTMKDLDM